MRISVIVPTYKPQEYLWECLDSLRSQTLAEDEFEVLIVLNGCKSPYYENIRCYIEQNNACHFQLIQTDVAGVSNARNVALDMAKGEYITFIDDDDYVSSAFLEELYKCASPSVVAISDVIAFQDKSRKIIKYSKTKNYKEISGRGVQQFYRARKFFSGPCMKLIHKDIISDRRYNINFRLGEDCLFMFLISDRMKYVRFASTDAVYYRRFRENSALTMKRSKIRLIENSIRLMCEYTKIFFYSMPRYNFDFYVTRMLGAMKSIIISREQLGH